MFIQSFLRILLSISTLASFFSPIQYYQGQNDTSTEPKSIMEQLLNPHDSTLDSVSSSTLDIMTEIQTADKYIQYPHT